MAITNNFNSEHTQIIMIKNKQYFIQSRYNTPTTGTFKVKISLLENPIFKCNTIRELNEYINKLNFGIKK